MLRSTLLALTLLALAGGAWAQRSFTGVVTHVSDGDSIWVRPATGGAPLAVRLQGIDAPEACQAWGPQSRDALSGRLLHRQVKVQVHGHDDYDRLLARVEWAGQDVGRWMVGRGLAWSYRFRRQPGAYDAVQAQARQARRGLWSDPRPLEPRAFRKRHGACVPHGG